MYNAGLLREILDAQLELVCRFARDGSILFVNNAYAATLGSSPTELTGSNLWRYVSAEDRAYVEAQVARLSPDQPTLNIENRFETAMGTRWVLWRNHALAFDADGQWTEAQSTGIDITERKRLEEQRQLLVDELNHRVRNTLMVVQGMAYQTFKGSGVPPVALDAFNARLHALAAAHTALSAANWVGAELAEVVRRGLAICATDPRVTADGPPATLRPSAAVALVLVLHELVTNAIKYGALTAHGGTVWISWRITEPADGPAGQRRLDLEWRERGAVLPVEPPRVTGFGTRLITDSITRQLDGTVDMAFTAEGLTCRMIFPFEPVGDGLPLDAGAPA